MKLLLIGLLVLAASASAWASESTSSESNSVEDLQDFVEKLRVGVASKTAQSLRDSPAILTVLTQDEIRDAGARDLMDALLLVPGFQFGVDVQGAVGLGVRGSWAHEGKALLLWDGHAMVE